MFLCKNVTSDRISDTKMKKKSNEKGKGYSVEQIDGQIKILSRPE